MKKIPTLFVRTFDERHRKSITEEIHPEMEWVLDGKGIATVKIDGSCCAVINGKFYKRYDAKRGKTPPSEAIPCCDPDSVTGHWPHWVPVDCKNPSDQWHRLAYQNSGAENLSDGTYEVIGPHFRNNPYGVEKDILVKHGEKVLTVPHSYEGLKEFLEHAPIEGIVFWKDDMPQCKIKRTDFGFDWPVTDVTKARIFSGIRNF